MTDEDRKRLEDERRELSFKDPRTDEDRKRLADLNEMLSSSTQEKSATPIWEVRKAIAEDLAKRLGR